MNFLSFDSHGHPSQSIYDVINYQGNRVKKVAADNNASFSGGLDLVNNCWLALQVFWKEHFLRHAIIELHLRYGKQVNTSY